MPERKSQADGRFAMNSVAAAIMRATWGILSGRVQPRPIGRRPLGPCDGGTAKLRA